VLYFGIIDFIFHPNEEKWKLLVNNVTLNLSSEPGRYWWSEQRNRSNAQFLPLIEPRYLKISTKVWWKPFRYCCFNGYARLTSSTSSTITINRILQVCSKVVGYQSDILPQLCTRSVISVISVKYPFWANSRNHTWSREIISTGVWLPNAFNICVLVWAYGDCIYLY